MKLTPHSSGGLSPLENLKKTASLFSSPELINDGFESSPSKRIITEIPDYRNWKSTPGPSIAKAIGLNHIRKKCPHFDKRIGKLESLKINWKYIRIR